METEDEDIVALVSELEENQEKLEDAIDDESFKAVDLTSEQPPAEAEEDASTEDP